MTSFVTKLLFMVLSELGCFVDQFSPLREPRIEIQFIHSVQHFLSSFLFSSTPPPRIILGNTSKISDTSAKHYGIYRWTQPICFLGYYTAKNWIFRTEGKYKNKTPDKQKLLIHIRKGWIFKQNYDKVLFCLSRTLISLYSKVGIGENILQRRDTD